MPRWVALSAVDNSSSLAALPLTRTSAESATVVPTHVGYGFSASRYSPETLESANHDHELRPESDRRVHVHLDSYTMGVAGYDSWSPNVDEEFHNRTEGTTSQRTIEINLLLQTNIQF